MKNIIPVYLAHIHENKG